MSASPSHPLSAIVAMTEDHVIGRGLDIPWKIKGEQKRFKELTTGHTIIMGRKTYDSIGRPLPNRRTLVITRQPNLQIEGVEVFSSVQKAIASRPAEEEIFIAGGGAIYEETLAQTHTLYLTVIHQKIAGDIFFPTFSWDDFSVLEKTFVAGDIPYTYYTLQRK